MFFSFFTLPHSAFSAAAAAAAADQLAAGEQQRENREKRCGKRVANEPRRSEACPVFICFVFAKRSHRGTRFWSLALYPVDANVCEGMTWTVG